MGWGQGWEKYSKGKEVEGEGEGNGGKGREAGVVDPPCPHPPLRYSRHDL